MKHIKCEFPPLSPTIITLLVAPISLLTGFWWLGVIVCIVCLCFVEQWWTCILGLLETIVLLWGIATCLFPVIYQVKHGTFQPTTLLRADIPHK